MLKLSFLLASVAFAQHSVTLNWTPSVSADVSGYNLYKCIGACSPTDPFSKINTVPVAGNTYTDSLVTAGATYTYAATAVSATAESVKSGTAGAVVPAGKPPRKRRARLLRRRAGQGIRWADKAQFWTVKV